jgi:hypothetical protein
MTEDNHLAAPMAPIRRVGEDKKRIDRGSLRASEGLNEVRAAKQSRTNSCCPRANKA